MAAHRQREREEQQGRQQRMRVWPRRAGGQEVVTEVVRDVIEVDRDRAEQRRDHDLRAPPRGKCLEQQQGGKEMRGLIQRTTREEGSAALLKGPVGQVQDGGAAQNLQWRQILSKSLRLRVVPASHAQWWQGASGFDNAVTLRQRGGGCRGLDLSTTSHPAR